uniref:Uncharacterized protein n=1 Tax=Myotis myotis TaxID=51298 RepID=A0A7J7XH18_MYOMY|nr:hypothetical protein mMyoMyo1_011581 [Myotis myotis]
MFLLISERKGEIETSMMRENHGSAASCTPPTGVEPAIGACAPTGTEPGPSVHKPAPYPLSHTSWGQRKLLKGGRGRSLGSPALRVRGVRGECGACGAVSTHRWGGPRPRVRGKPADPERRPPCTSPMSRSWFGKRAPATRVGNQTQDGSIPPPSCRPPSRPSGALQSGPVKRVSTRRLHEIPTDTPGRTCKPSRPPHSSPAETKQTGKEIVCLLFM